MSLNNINLNPQLLTRLYAHTLLEAGDRPAPAAKPEAPAVVKKNIEAPSPSTPGLAAPAQKNENTAPPLAPALPKETELQVKEQPVEYGNTPSLGGNKKGVLVLVNNASVPYLPDVELEFLSNILSACRLSIADVAIVNLHHYPQPYTTLLQQFGSKQVLLMGITPQQIDLPFHFPHFQLQPFDGRTYLSSFPLGEMVQNRDLKMQLWGSLKRMFGV